MYSYKDFQVTTFDFTSNQGRTINAPSERSYGFEVEGTLRPTSHLQISASAAYLNAEFRNFPNATIQVKQTVEVAPGNFVETGGWVSAPQDASGTRAPRSPKWSGNLAATYGFDIGPGEVELTANVNYSSSLYNLMNEQFRNPAYAEVGLNATFTPSGGHWKVQGFVTNLTNKHRFGQYQGGPFGTYVLYAPPRVFGGSLSFDF